MSKSRNYVFTINNWTQRDIEQLNSIRPRVRYLGWAEEIGAEGTPHLQGCICLNNATTMRSLSKTVRRAAWKVMRGTPKQARDYYADNPDKEVITGLYEYGELPLDRDQQAQSQSDRFSAAVALARAGKIDLIDPELMVRFYATWLKMAKQSASKPANLSEAAKCIWIWGPTRTGKSHAVRNQFPDAYLKQCNKWWDGYDGEKVVYIEDLDPDFAKWGGRFLKTWADQWTYSGEVKGSSGVFRPEAILVTSNYSIEQMGFRREDSLALQGRFTEFYKDSQEDEIPWAEFGFMRDELGAEERELLDISVESINLI